MHGVSVPTIHGLFASPVSFQSFLDEVPLGAMLLDRDRRILFMNRAMEALTGFERRDACGICCMNILRNAVCVEGCPLEHDDFPAIGAPECLEGNIVNRERKKIPVRITVVPMIDLVGACCGFLETVEDLRLSGSGNWKADHAYRFGHLIGNSPQMEKIFQILPMVGQTESSVLITGETGTGKDLVAEAIHLASDRSKGPFIKVNCGALPCPLPKYFSGHSQRFFVSSPHGDTKPNQADIGPARKYSIPLWADWKQGACHQEIISKGCL
jgi:two-component system, NtrC family, response regulator AtoC